MSILLIMLTLSGACYSFFVIKPNDTLAILGDNTQLNCTYEVSGLAAWYKGVGEEKEAITLGNTIVGNDTQYELIGDKENVKYDIGIENVTMNNEDNYECGDQVEIDVRAPAHLYVIDKSPICSVEPRNILKAGENATFTCTIDLNENAPGELVWFRNGSEIYREEGHRSLVTVRLDKSDNGIVYYCELQHFTLPSGKWPELRCKKPVVIDVQYLPIVVLRVTPTTNVTEREEVFMDCKTFGGNPNPYNLTLLHNEKIIMSDNASHIHHQISSISRSESGIYRCEAFTKFHNGTEVCSSEEKRINVQYSAALNKTLETTFQAEINESVALVCEAYGFPTPVIHWSSGSGSTISGLEESRNITTVISDETTTTSTLRILIFNETYYGEYTCVASNGIPPSVNQTMGINPYDGPKTNKSKTSVVAIILPVVCAVIGITIVAVVCIYWYRVRNTRKSRRRKGPRVRYGSIGDDDADNIQNQGDNVSGATSRSSLELKTREVKPTLPFEPSADTTGENQTEESNLDSAAQYAGGSKMIRNRKDKRFRTV